MSVSPLISVAQAVLSGLTPLAAEQIKGMFNFKEDLETLHRRLNIIQALLSDAENGQGKIRSQVMRVWLRNLMLAACKAENVLDKIAYESLRHKVEVQKRDRVSNFFSNSNPLLFRPKIAYKVKEVNTLLDKICKEATEIGLDPSNQLINATVVVEPGNQLRLTVPYVDDSRIVGKDDDASRVREMLLGSGVEDDLPVVAIVGMGGLGKTTLAQLLYKDKELVNSFDEKMWVCASDYFDIKILLNEMIQSLTGDKSETPNIEGIVRKLRQKLNGKKYLLVLK